MSSIVLATWVSADVISTEVALATERRDLSVVDARHRRHPRRDSSARHDAAVAASRLGRNDNTRISALRKTNTLEAEGRAP